MSLFCSEDQFDVRQYKNSRRIHENRRHKQREMKQTMLAETNQLKGMKEKSKTRLFFVLVFQACLQINSGVSLPLYEYG